MSKHDATTKPVIGWREWVALPDLGIADIKAKVDTGARSSALHAFDVHVVETAGGTLARFKVHPHQRDAHETVECEAEVLEYRQVRSSSGKSTLRPVILTTVELMGQRLPIELTLINRVEMGFRMLLGREAFRRRFLVDAGRSFLNGDRWKKGSRKKKGKGRRKKKVAPGRLHDDTRRNS